MTKLKRIAHATAIATALVVLSTSPIKAPLVDGKYFETKTTTMFIPSYNTKQQPNIVETAPSEKTAAFVEQLKKSNPNVDWKDGFSAGIFLKEAISRMKKYDTSDEAIKKYLKEMKGSARITPDTFLEISGGFCMERSALLTASLKYLGFSAKPFVLDEQFSDIYSEQHMLVGLKTKQGILYLDPLHNIHSYQIQDYVLKYLSIVGKDPAVKKRHVYGLVPYKDEYMQKYGVSDSAEEKLNVDFKHLKKEVLVP